MERHENQPWCDHQHHLQKKNKRKKKHIGLEHQAEVMYSIIQSGVHTQRVAETLHRAYVRQEVKLKGYLKQA